MIDVSVHPWKDECTAAFEEVRPHRGGEGARRSPCRPRPHELPLRGLLTKHPGRASIPESTETTDKWTNGCTEGQDVGFVSLSIDGWTDERVNDRMTAWC